MKSVQSVANFLVPMGTNDGRQRAILRQIARRAMVERGLLPDFSREALEELGALQQKPHETGVLDLRDLLWVSIDNDHRPPVTTARLRF